MGVSHAPFLQGRPWVSRPDRGHPSLPPRPLRLRSLSRSRRSPCSACAQRVVRTCPTSIEHYRFVTALRYSSAVRAVLRRRSQGAVGFATRPCVRARAAINQDFLSPDAPVTCHRVITAWLAEPPCSPVTGIRVQNTACAEPRAQTSGAIDD
jgi:hypothetical protein